MFLTYLFFHTLPSLPILFACCLVFLGFLLGVLAESRVIISPLGIFFGVLSSISTALHAVIIKKSYALVKDRTFDLVYYNNLLSSICLAPMLLLEVKDLAGLLQDDTGTRCFLYGTVIAGASGLLVNIAGFLQIKVTSPITHTISSAARGVLQTLAASFLLGEIITPHRTLGILVTLVGTCLYTWLKSLETAQAAPLLPIVSPSHPNHVLPLAKS